MKIYWLKLAIDIFDNAKIKKIRRLAGGNEYFVLWIGILTLGMKSKKYGVLEITDGIPYMPEDLADSFDLTIECVKEGLNIFEKLGMIQIFNGDTIEISNFRRDQSLDRIEQVKELARIRQEKHRNKLKLEYKQDKEKDEDLDLDKEKARESRVTKFIPPTVEQVAEYIQNTKYSFIDPQHFVDHYTANGWKRGNTKIKDWKACLRTWKNRNDDYNKNKPQQFKNSARQKDEMLIKSIQRSAENDRKRLQNSGGKDVRAIANSLLGHNFGMLDTSNNGTS